MNLKVRFKNPVFLTTFIATIVSFIYQICGLLGVVPAASEDQVTQLIGLIINILALMGVLVDPTTKGVGDSEQALTYTEPK